MNAFFTSEDLLAFIGFRFSPSNANVEKNTHFRWSSLRGSDHFIAVVSDVSAVAGTCLGFVIEMQISLFLSIGPDATKTLQLVITMRSSQMSCQTYDKVLNEYTISVQQVLDHIC